MSKKRMVLVGVGIFVIYVSAVWAMRLISPYSSSVADQSSELLEPGGEEEIRNAVRSAGAPFVLINFWASWCGPCREEFPALLRLRKTYADRGLKLLLVSVDESAGFTAAQEFLKQQGVDFPTLYKGSHSVDMLTAINPNWTGAIPASVLVDPEAHVLTAWEGSTPAKEFSARISQFVK